MNDVASIHFLQARVIQAAQGLRSAYYRLILLIGEPGAGKTEILNRVAGEQAWQMVNLNLSLSERLLELTHRKRALRVSALVEEIVAALSTETVLIDNLEILFSPALQLDPLRLLQSLARNRTVVAAWPGSVDDGNLTYASSGHLEHRRYIKPDAILVRVGDTADHLSKRPPHTDPGT